MAAKRTAYCLGALLSAGLVTAAEADIVQATYQITASDFRDSNGNSPSAATSNLVQGQYTFTFDTGRPQQTEIVPDAVVGLDITAGNGVTTDYDESNSGVNTAINIFTDSGRFTIGGLQSSVAFMVGISNDFRLKFDISLLDYEVTSIVEDLVFVTVVNAFYTAELTTVELIAFSVMPDTDADGLPDSADNCALAANSDQRDTDGDGIGNLCDPDFDQSCLVNFADLAVMSGNFFLPGDLDTDLDGDGFTNFADLEIMQDLFFLAPGPSGTPNICP